MINESKFKNARLSDEYFYQLYDVASIKDHSDIKQLTAAYDYAIRACVLSKEEVQATRDEIRDFVLGDSPEGLDSYL